MNNQLQISEVKDAILRPASEHFKVRQLGMNQVGIMTNPVLNIDHYVTTERNFDAHPHAGFSAVTYVLENSQGAIHNRDSRGDDSIINPGDLHWTLAGSGIVHDEIPSPIGVPSEGIQLFVNLHPENRMQEPKVFKLKSQEAPRVLLNSGLLKVVTGQFGAVRSPLQLAEHFDFFDIQLGAGGSFSTQPFANSGGLIYVLKGEINLQAGDIARTISEGQFVAMKNGDSKAEISFNSKENAKALYLLGEHNEHPFVGHGPFIMNNQNDILKTIQRYQSGKMGRL